MISAERFQFPSSGKVHPKRYNMHLTRNLGKFQFPSSGKVHPKREIARLPWGEYFRFNSLQAGRYIQSRDHDEYNGLLLPSFNSLQAGRYIQSSSTSGLVDWLIASFNSLQAGRYIQRVLVSNFRVWFSSVSIPFKREGTSKGQVRRTCKQSSVSCFNSLQAGRYIQSSDGRA